MSLTWTVRCWALLAECKSSVPFWLLRVLTEHQSRLDTASNEQLDPELEGSEVCPLTHFFCWPFLKKNHCSAWRADRLTHHWGQYYYLSILQATPSCLSWTLEGLFEQTRRPSTPPILATHAACWALEIQRHPPQVFRAKYKGLKSLSKNKGHKLW